MSVGFQAPKVVTSGEFRVTLRVIILFCFSWTLVQSSKRKKNVSQLSSWGIKIRSLPTLGDSTPYPEAEWTQDWCQMDKVKDERQARCICEPWNCPKLETGSHPWSHPHLPPPISYQHHVDLQILPPEYQASIFLSFCNLSIFISSQDCYESLLPCNLASSGPLASQSILHNLGELIYSKHKSDHIPMV